MFIAELAQPGLRQLQAAFIEIDRGDMRANPGEINRRGAADTATATRHHTHAA
jgi:hypothetical protein